MNKLDSIVEQIAFGKETRKPSPSLGLYMSPDTIYLAESHLDKSGKLVVDHLVRIPIPSSVKSAVASPGAAANATMNTDFLTDPQKVAGLVRQSMSQMRWNVKNVRVTLSHHLGLLRYFSMPSMESRFLRTAIPLEAKKYIPIPFDVLAHDYQSMPLPVDAGGKPRLGVLIAVTQIKNIANIQGLLASLGLKLDGVELAPCSVLRLWQGIDPIRGAAPFAHVHMDGGNVRVMVSEHGVPIFFREVFLGADPTLNDLRKIDLAGCLSYIQKQLGIPGVSQVRVSGNIANIEEFRAAFSMEAGVEARIQDTPSLLSVKSGDWGGYAALGASVHSLVPTPMTLDLAAADRVSDEERSAARNILLVGAALAAGFGLAGIAKSASYSLRSRELRKYPLSADVKKVFGTKSNSQLDFMFSEMQKQLDQLRSVTPSARPRASAVLREIIALMPPQLWITHMTITDPMLDGERVPFHITIAGHAQDATAAVEQELAFKLKDDLLKSLVVGKFYDVQIAIVHTGLTDAGATNSPGLDPDHLRDKLEGRTEFTLDIATKR
jgi:hypothetical protein